MTYKKKLIEVAIPLEAINAASAREKSIRHGHPSTLHLWWARRPLAACRAVLFAQLVDDPSSRVEELLADPNLRARAEAELPERVLAWENSKASAKGAAAETPEPTLEDVAVDLERKRLFAIIEDLVEWENSTNEEVLERARAEIKRSCDGELPPVYDPFSGGGSIPLEAQRLGLPAYGSDLNPVAVMIGKAMIEIPPRFKDRGPIHPGAKDRQFYRNAEGLAEDVKYYGEWARKLAWERIGHLYPEVDLPKQYGGGKGTVIAWLWARTVPSPDPAFANVQVPIASSFLLSSKSGKEAWVEPIADKARQVLTYRVREGKDAEAFRRAKKGTKAGHGANFTCVFSGAAITPKHIKDAAKRGKLGTHLLAVVVSTPSGRKFISPSPQHVEIANSAAPTDHSGISLPNHSQYIGVLGYGFETFDDLFTPRQRAMLQAYTEIVPLARAEILKDALQAGMQDDGLSLSLGGSGADALADAVAMYLALGVGRLADIGNSLCNWSNSADQAVHLFGRQAIPMVWDFAETGAFSGRAGDYSTSLNSVFKVLNRFVPHSAGFMTQHDAQSVEYPSGVVISTDPPYYDNVPYADLSDFFYTWLRMACRDIYPDLTSTLAVPKMEELVADRVRHRGVDAAQDFFMEGMTNAIKKMADATSDAFPTTIYYAFKQSQDDQDGVSSAGWSTFLEAVVGAGFSIVGTWPVRTERGGRMRANASNALANSVVLVCRKRGATAEVVTRAEFVRTLKRELPSAIAELQAANITPADMPQSAIGPGMGVFSRYKAVLEADDSPMTVKAALQLINAELDEYLGGIQGEFDADTRFAISWFEQNGIDKGDYGLADNLARARGISVDSAKHAGIVESAAGKVRLLSRDELDPDWEPSEDNHLTVWECLQHLVRLHENDGLSWETVRMMRMIGSRAEATKDLAYCLYDIAANKRKDASEAIAYNAIIADWTEMSRQAAKIHDTRRDGQAAFDL